MDVTNYVFLIPFAVALIFFTVNIISDSKKYKMKARKNNIYNLLYKGLSVFLPKDNSGIWRFYSHKLRFTNFSVEQIIKLKFLLFVFTIFVCVLVKLTNISMYTKDIFSKFDYQCDLIYQSKLVVSEEVAMQQEIHYLNIVLLNIKRADFSLLGKEDLQAKIKALINISDSEVYLPKDTLANKIYYRLDSYYGCRHWNILLYLFIGLCITFIPDVFLILRNYFAKADSKKEIKFLKKLIIINGSIKPVDFMELLKLLIDKAKYHKKMLCDIEEKNKKNSVNKRCIYQQLIKNAKDIDTKLFYEKLDQANNYDFDQAVLNIENEFKMEKRSELRKVRKQIEIIHAAGIIGFMLLVVILIFYLIIPWIEAYSMNQII